MEITNNYSDYGKGYTNTAKESNVTTSTVELKTPTGGTKTEQIKTGYSDVILSRLVDTFSSRILYPMLLLSGNHSIAAVLSWEEDLH